MTSEIFHVDINQGNAEYVLLVYYIFWFLSVCMCAIKNSFVTKDPSMKQKSKRNRNSLVVATGNVRT